MNLLIGDSHSLRMSINNCDHIPCLGGSAMGLSNDNSKSGFNKHILSKIKKKHERFIFLFGGVDVDFVYVLKHMRGICESYDEFNLTSVKKYLDFIVSNFNGKHVLILSVGLPTLDDTYIKKIALKKISEYIEDKEEQKRMINKINNNLLPNIHERTLVTLNYNKHLEEEIKKLDNKYIHFLDVTSFTYSEHQKRIMNNFFTKSDHHNFLRNKTIVPMIEKYIRNNMM